MIAKYLLKLLILFSSRFQDFRKKRDDGILLYPLKCDFNLMDVNTFSGISIADLQMEILEIQNKSIWVQKLQEMVAQVERNEVTMEETPQDIIFKCWNFFPDNTGKQRFWRMNHLIFS